MYREIGMGSSPRRVIGASPPPGAAWPGAPLRDRRNPLTRSTTRSENLPSPKSQNPSHQFTTFLAMLPSLNRNAGTKWGDKTKHRATLALS